jgi:serine/threonine-protein kinase RsbT
MTPTSERVLSVLRRYAPESTARVLLLRACLEHELSPHDLTAAQLAQILPRLSNKARIAIGARRSDALIAALGALTQDRVVETRHEIEIRDEHDARRARLLVRSACEDAGAEKLVGLKIATGLSELTRNILSYAGSGVVQIAILETPRRVRVEARDHGPGIADVELVLSGRYKSRTGLGRGLLGTKKMSDVFEIRSDPSGTHVVFEMLL